MENRPIPPPSISTSIIKEGDHDTFIDSAIPPVLFLRQKKHKLHKKYSCIPELMLLLLNQMVIKAAVAQV